MKIFSILLICLGFVGSAFGAGLDPTGGAVTATLEAAKQADALSDRGLFLASQIVLIVGFCLGGWQLLKRLDNRETKIDDLNKEHKDFLQTRLAEMTSSLDQSNALGLKTNLLLDDLKDLMKK